MCFASTRWPLAFVGGWLAATSVLSAGLQAQEWTRFRGPNGSGISADAFNDPIGEHDIAWKVELPGIGHSSPVVWGDKVFVTCAEAETAKRIVVCLNSADGSIAFRAR